MCVYIVYMCVMSWSFKTKNGTNKLEEEEEEEEKNKEEKKREKIPARTSLRRGRHHGHGSPLQ